MITAHRGSTLHTLGWPQEAALRMLQNNLDPEVAEHPENLVVYGGTGKAARDWPSFHAIVRTLETLRGDETLLVQSGKPVGVMQTHEWAPRVLLANSNLVGDWANWDEFRRLEQLGLTMYGQMTAGSWIYIGTQGILQGTFETFAAVADKKFGGTLAGTITLTAGLGGMGGAQPLAVTMNDGVAICIDVDPSRIARRIEHGYLDVRADSVEHALELAYQARDARQPLSIGVLGNAATVVPSLLEMGAEIDIVTDQTSAHDPLAYLPLGIEFEDWEAEKVKPGFADRARGSMAKHVAAMVGFQRAGAEVFDYGNNIRTEALAAGYSDAFAFPGFVPAYIRPLFAEGKGPFRWAALSGEASDIAKTDRAVLELFPENRSLQRWIPMAQKRVHFQGLPARICWLGYGERDKAGERFNDMVASGELAAPVVIGRDHLDSGSVASPYRETESMKDGSDAIADWPLLNALVNTASGATWVSIHHGGGVGIGRSIHAGQVTVADGTKLAGEKIARVLTNDPGMGVIRHVDAGYDEAIEVADRLGVRIPMQEGLMQLPHDPLWPRAGDWPSPVVGQRADVALVGIPTYRTSLSPTSAHLTPRAVREALRRYSLETTLRIVDAGDAPDPDLVDAAPFIAALDAQVVIALGGDNAATVPVAIGRWGSSIAEAGLVTVDAHHDLRDGVSNGSPVRQLLEAGLDGRRVTQVGIEPLANSAAYRRRADDAGITVVLRHELHRRPISDVVVEAIDRAAAAGGPVHVDLDVDVCDRAAAPACPASVPGGISAAELRAAARAAGAHPAVTSIDLTEVDAAADAADGRTVRLAALCVLEIIAGVAQR